jgi:CHAT domain-containing protein
MPRPNVGLLVVAGVLACADSHRGALHSDDIHATTGSRLPRRFPARLSMPVAYRSCHAPSDTSTDLGWHCDAEPGDEVPSPALIVASTRGRSHADSIERTHVRAIADLAWHDPEGKSIDRSIHTFDALASIDANPYAPMVDRSAAHLLLADQRREPVELLLALDEASRVLSLDSNNAPAAYNRALALDMLGATTQALAAWRRYVAVDANSPWADEARARVASLGAISVDATSPPFDATDSLLRAFAGRAPAEARVVGWEGLLGIWGRGVISGFADSSRVALHAAGVVARALGDAGGDRTLDDAVREIRATSDRSALRRLAGAHARYAEAQQNYRRTRYEAADSLFVFIEKEAPASARSVRAWARFGRAGTRLYLRRADEAERLAREVATAADSIREPGLFGMAWWRYAAILTRRGAWDQALASLGRSRAALARIGERENVAAVEGIIGNSLAAIGNKEEASRWVWRVVRRTQPYRGSIWRHNAMADLVRVATAEHLAAASAVLAEEDVAVAATNGAPTYIAESNIVAAEAFRALGDTVRSGRFARAALEALARHDPGTIHDDLAAQLQTVRALTFARSQPVTAVALADSAIAFFGVTRNPFRLVPLHIARGDALRAQGRLELAEKAFGDAAALVDRQRRNLRKPTERAALRAVRRDLVDRMVMLLVDQQRVADALALVEDRDQSPASAMNDAEIAFAMVGDTLLTWVRRKAEVSFDRRVLSRAELSGTISRVTAGLALGAGDAQLDRDLALLYDQLIAPSAKHLPPAGRELTVIADDDIGDVPFAALYDSRDSAYLVAKYAVVYASRFGRRPVSDATAPIQQGAAARPLFFGVPVAFRSAAELARLDRADEEARSASRMYSGATARVDAAADSASLVSLLPQASLFHFAGHAVFDDVNPDQSYLATSSGPVTAQLLAGLDLARLQLVVLSACDATRSGRTRNAGSLGIADAFLAAGAAGVIGPTWPVTDSTAAELTLAFHRAYAARADPAVALRNAQLVLMRSSNAALTSPASWAAFRFVADPSQ